MSPRPTPFQLAIYQIEPFRVISYIFSISTVPLEHAFAPSTRRDPRPFIYSATQANETPVIDAYARSLRVTFISAIAVFVIVNVLIFAIELPRLDRKQPEEEESSTPGTDEEQ
jgi:hypothetical protein